MIEVSHRCWFHMDFFYHYPPITTTVSVEFTDNVESNLVFFDRVDIGLDELKGLFPGPLSDFAVTITPEPEHPAFPPTGLAFSVAPHDRKVRQGHSQSNLRCTIYLCNRDVPYACPPHRRKTLGSKYS
jgi:hypothetical protein